VDRPSVRVLPPPDDTGTKNGPRRRTRLVWMAGYVAVLLVAALAVGAFSAWMASSDDTATMTEVVPSVPTTAASLRTAAATPAKSTSPATPTHESDEPVRPAKAGTGQKPAASAPKKGGKTASAGKPAAVKALAVTAAGNVVATSVVEGTAYSFLNTVTSKCVTADAASILQFGCGSRGGQLWALERTRTVNSAALYRIRSRTAVGTCVHAPSVARQAILTVATCPTIAASAGSNDEWKLQEIGATYQGRPEYALVNAKSSFCFDVEFGIHDGSDQPDGTRYSLFNCQDDDGNWDDHLWVFS